MKTQTPECEDCGVAPRNDNAGPFSGVRSYALDPARARALWTCSEEWTRTRFALQPGSHA